MNNKIKGKLNQVKGGIKTKVGKMTDNNKLQVEGTMNKVVGKTQEISGNIKEAVIGIKKKLTK